MKTGYPSIDRPWLQFYDSALTEDDIPKCSVYHLLYENNKEHLEDTALIYFDRKISFKVFFNKIKKAASAFNKLGIEKGDIVTLQVLNMPQTIIIFYALSYIGAVANIIYVTSSESELNAILKNTESKMFVTIDSLWDKMKSGVKDTEVENVLLLKVGEEADIVTKTVLGMKKSSKDKKCFTWNKFLKLGELETAVEINQSDIPVAMVYTSGTTGKSKAVVLANKSMNSLVCQYDKAGIGLSRGGTFMNSLPEFIAFGLVFSMHVPLCLGLIDVVILDPKATSAGKYFAKYKPNFFVNGKAAVENIIDNKKVRKMNLKFVKVLAAGGEAMPYAFEKKVREFLVNGGAENILSIGYGMTEVAATVVTSTPRVNRMGTVGIPLPGTIIKVVEPETTKELTYNTDGEICFSAPTMMLGYYKQEEETKNIIKRHEDGLLWVHSGDIGKISEDGFLSVVGRIKRIITIQKNGIYHKVFPKLIEDKFDQRSDIEEIVIVGRKKPVIENELVAFIVKKGDETENLITKRLIEFAEQELETWERPIEYKYITSIPRSTVGKVDYRKLESLVEE